MKIIAKSFINSIKIINDKILINNIINVKNTLNINYFFCKNNSNFLKKIKSITILLRKLNELMKNITLLNFLISINTTYFLYNFLNIKLKNNQIIFLINKFKLSNFFWYKLSLFKLMKNFPCFLIYLNNSIKNDSIKLPNFHIKKLLKNDYSLLINSKRFFLIFILIKYFYTIIINNNKNYA